MALLFLGVVVESQSAAGDTHVDIVPGQAIADIVDQFRAQGFQLAYSTSLLTPDIKVLAVPKATEPLDIIRELLKPYGMALEAVSEVYVVHRITAPALPGHSAPPAQKSGSIAELTVSASRYEFLRNSVSPGAFIDQQQMQQLPTLGDDPVRAAQTVPGVSASDTSAKSYARGGEARDTGIILNGSKLLEPYHVRNFQSLFSTIDSRAIDGIEVFTGNYPVRYGNETGGLMIIDTLAPPKQPHTEIGLSTFNTSLLSTGQIGDTSIGWLVSARRGNLDLIVDEDFGQPRYNDVLVQLSASISNATSLSLNGLVSNDQIHLVTESNPDDTEVSNNSARNGQFWLNWTQDWSENLRSVTTVSSNDFDDDREEHTNEPSTIVAIAKDTRNLEISRIGQRWQWQPADSRHALDFGFEFEELAGDYVYQGSADYFGVYRLIDNLPDSIRRQSNLSLHGRTYSAYLSDEINISTKTVARLGLRWDAQNYETQGQRKQFSPRFSLVHEFSPGTEMRASIGRFYQAEGIHELQVEDGIDRFFDAQRMDTATVGFEHRSATGLVYRAEAYWKTGDHIRPRFENVLNTITILPEFQPDRMMIAPSEFRSRGVELSVRRAADSGFSWWASYVLSSAEDKIDGRYVPRSWDQRHAVRLGLSIAGRKWELGAIATTHSGWPKTSLVLDAADPEAPQLDFTDRNSERYGSYMSVDVRIRREVPVKTGSLSFFVDISNVLNRKNPCCIDFNVDSGPTGAAELDTEQNDWLPLVPSVGVLWQF